MSETPKLHLPLIQERQAQKHITVNESLKILDTLAQLTTQSITLTAPPETPQEGDAFIIAAAPIDAWEGKAQHLAIWQDQHWVFLAPKIGWTAWNIADNKRYTYYDDAWQES